MSGTPSSRAILIVDDDDIFRARLARAFQARELQTLEAGSWRAALDAARQVAPELAVVDLRLPDRSGLDVVRDLKGLNPAINIVVLTGYGSIATALEAVRLGATHYLPKPADVDDILAGFARAELPPGKTPPPAPCVPSLARTEWEHINRVLADCGGNISRAADLLGIHRRSLQRKLAKYPVRR
jgi:two-component system response regulator RegA